MLTLDPFQQRAVAAIDRDESVLVAAPTGAGKTLVADHAVDRALARGRKAFYTTPLKALSNQKFRDIAARLGRDNVGLLTGDVVVRPTAPVVVMTTEVLRALLYERAPLLDGLDVVVLDEFHYLQDPDRGPVWEEVVVHAPPSAALVCLSATLADLPVLHRWLERVHGPTELIVEDERPVSLQYLYAIGNLQRTQPLVLPMFLDGGLNPTAEMRDGVRKVQRGEGKRVRDRTRPVTPYREDLLAYLADGSMLPAIWFVLSRTGCDRAVSECIEAGVRLTTHDESAAIDRLVTNATERLDAADARTLDASGWRLALACGIAAHHGGLAPIQREVVELAAAEGWVKVVFATETLALGVNLPARTVVIDRISRRAEADGGGVLTAADFAQLAGRAGRRGLDSVGYVVVPRADEISFHRVAGLAGGRTEPLRSHFRATPAMAANLVRAYAPDEARDRFRRSLAHHLLEIDLDGLRAARDSREAELAETSDDEDATAPRASTVVDRGAQTGRALAALQVGDVVVDAGRRSTGEMLVVARPRVRRGEATIDIVRGDARRVAVTASDFRGAPVVVGRIDLTDLVAGARGFARTAAARVTAARDAFTIPEETDLRSPGARFIADDGRRRKRLSDELARLSARIDALEDGYDHDLDVMFDLLRRRGHLDGWTLTRSGLTVSRLFHARGLLVAECLARGAFDDLDAAGVAALLSGFRPTARRELAPSPFPTGELRGRWDDIMRVTIDLQRSESAAGLDPSPAPDPSLLTPIHRWTSGASLADTLAQSPIGPGDLAREVRQVIELAEQVVEVAPPALADTTREAIIAMARGVVVVTAHDDTGDRVEVP